MNNEQQQIIDEISILKTRLSELEGSFYKNNFSSSQIFTKDCNFATKLKVPHYDTLPPCQVGELLESGGTLYICSATDTWTVVGTQV